MNIGYILLITPLVTFIIFTFTLINVCYIHFKFLNVQLILITPYTAGSPNL